MQSNLIRPTNPNNTTLFVGNNFQTPINWNTRVLKLN